MVNLMEKTESAFRADEEIIGGDIYIGCGETPAMEFITELFKEIQTDYPGIHFHIYSGDADAVLERLDKGLLDAGLLLGPMQQEKYDYINIFKSDIYGLLMPRDCSLAEKTDCFHCGLIQYSSDFFRSDICRPSAPGMVWRGL